MFKCFFTEDTVAKINRETQTLRWMNEWMNESQRNIVEFEMFASCVLFSPDCHASLWSSWPAQLDWCVLGLCRPGPSLSSSSSHHIPCEERKIRPAACISALRRLLPALPSSTAVQPAKKSVPIGYLHPVISRLYGWDGAALPCVLRDRSAQNSAAARSDWETASSCSWASFTWCCGFIRGGGRWSRLIWTQDDGPVSHWASDRGASRFLPYQMMFSLFRGCYQGSDQ